MSLKHFLIAMWCVIGSSHAFAQAVKRRLPSSVNHPAINHFAPYMSFDGDAIVFLSDNAEDNALTPFYSYRDGRTDWHEPSVLPKTLFTKLNFLWGYTLGPEGRVLYFSTIKSPGVGGYDLWVSERKGSSWSQPVNLGVPVNSRSNEACVTLTPDQSTIYFMRCEKMDQVKASGCVILSARKKSNGQWGEPVELPPVINTGNSQAPRILADSETLIFSSDRFSGNKGAMDLYLSRLRDGVWSKPVPLNFVNTADNDQYISVNAVGRYLLRDAPGNRKREMVEYLIPEDLRPKGLMRVEGRIAGTSGGSASAYVSVTDLLKGKRIFNGRPNADGSFTLFLLEGSRYEVSVDPEQNNFSFFSRTFDLTHDSIEQIVRMPMTIKPVEKGDELDLQQVGFQENSATLMPESENELKRVARLIKGNPNYQFEIQVMMTGYLEDSIKSSPDLTEVLYDSVLTTYDDIDSLGQLYQRDTVMVSVRYHNDRTADQAQTVVAYLAAQGIDENRLNYFVNAIPAVNEERKRIVVKARVKP